MKRLKLACYTTNITMSIVGNLSPLLFLTFRSLYGISFSLLGTLVLVNFVTQLGIDLVFSFFSHKFNIPLTVRLTPLIAVVGLLFYAAAPLLFPALPFVGILIGTVIFSAASGLGEVLISPVIATLPSENPDREMSKLHSVYAWGVVGVVLFGSLFLFIFGQTAWGALTLLLTLVPLTSSLLFARAEIPPMQTPERTVGALKHFKNKTLWLSIAAIFFGGAAECTMAQWCSGFLEAGLGIPKLWGDIFGVAMFAAMLGLGRTLYSAIGKNITRVLLWGSIGATVCYLAAVFTPLPVIGLLACAITGFCTSMLWPGNLVAAEQRVPNTGVFLFAVMAAGGDLGASVGPQLVGIVADLAGTPEQGLRLGMLVAALFPCIGIFISLKLHKDTKQ